MQLAGDTVRYMSKTLKKTRALYLKWLGRSTHFERSKTSKIVKIRENLSVPDYMGPFVTLKLVLDYVLR